MTTAKRHPRSGELYADLAVEARRLRKLGHKVAFIAKALDVTAAAVSGWCAGMPEHDEATRANIEARTERRRVYPEGYRKADVVSLMRKNVPQAERARVLASRSSQMMEARA